MSAKHFHGEPCAKCGSTVRYRSTRNCVGCAKANVKAKRANLTDLQQFDLMGNLNDYRTGTGRRLSANPERDSSEHVGGNVNEAADSAADLLGFDDLAAS